MNEPRFEMFGVIGTFAAEQQADEAALMALEQFFKGNMGEARKCEEEYQRLLDAGDDAAERGEHRWAHAERAMVDAVFSACEVNESQWAGISVLWN